MGKVSDSAPVQVLEGSPRAVIRAVAGSCSLAPVRVRQNETGLALALAPGTWACSTGPGSCIGGPAAHREKWGGTESVTAGSATERKERATRGWCYDPRWARGEPALERTPKDPLGAGARCQGRGRGAEVVVLVARAIGAAAGVGLADGPPIYL